MAIVKKTIVKGQKLTKKQLLELEAASKMPVIYKEKLQFLIDYINFNRIKRLHTVRYRYLASRSVQKCFDTV